MCSLDDLSTHKEHNYKHHENWNVQPSVQYPDYDKPMLPLSEERYNDEEEAIVKRYVGFGVSWVSLITENLLSHPFVVLRRQCQVNHSSKSYHLLPYSLIPVVIHLHQRQGITTLWKGLGSVLLVRGMILGIEDLLSKLTPWPKDISWESSIKQFFRHLMLKCVSLALITPFYSASLVETVQSDVASEKPGILDVFKEGAVRLVHWGKPQRGRLLPIWALIIPTVTLGIARYLFCLTVRGGMTRFFHLREKIERRKQGAFSKDVQCINQDHNINATLVSIITTDIIFFPFETVLHRLHLQGTRTIVDNLDNGFSVLPILTNYESTFDCYDKSISAEGVSGLYKGFGSMILQYTVHVALIRVTKFLMTKLSRVLRSNQKAVIRTSPPVIYPQHDPSSQNYLVP